MQAALALRTVPLLPWVRALVRMFKDHSDRFMPGAIPGAVSSSSSPVGLCFRFMFSPSHHPVMAFAAQSLGLLRFKRSKRLVCTSDVKLLRCSLYHSGSFFYPVWHLLCLSFHLLLHPAPSIAFSSFMHTQFSHLDP